jgi:ketosteroid isomerase-like protein
MIQRLRRIRCRLRRRAALAAPEEPGLTMSGIRGARLERELAFAYPALHCARRVHQGGGMSPSADAVKAIYESFGKGDVQGILARLATDVAWEHDWGGETLKWFEQRRGRDAVPGFFASLADFEFVRFEPFAFLEGDGMVAVPVRLELVCKASAKRIHDLEMHLWTFGSDGLVTGFRHFVDTHQWAQATRA